MAQYLPERANNNPLCILDFVDLDSRKWQDYAAHTKHLSRWIYEREARLLLSYEIEIAPKADFVTFVSDFEAERFRGYLPEYVERITAIPNGAELPEISALNALARPQKVNAKTIAFVGVMDYLPNVDAVIWFCDEVLPALRDVDPEINFVIVGANPAPEVKRLAARGGVSVTGAVECVRPYLYSAGAVAIPLRIPQGVPNKILEAMALGKPVVTTPLAIKGLHRIVPGQDLLVAQSADDFAKSLTKLFLEKELAEQLGKAARACIGRHYQWGPSLARFDALMSAKRPLASVGE